MKNLTSVAVNVFALILISGGAFAPNLHAQYESGIVVTVPFAFSVGGQNLAAGTYQFHLVSNSFLLSIRNETTGNEQIAVVRPEQQGTYDSRGKLIFQQCGGRSHLTQVHVPGANLYSAVGPARGSRSRPLEACSRADSVTIASR